MSSSAETSFASAVSVLPKSLELRLNLATDELLMSLRDEGLGDDVVQYPQARQCVEQAFEKVGSRHMLQLIRHAYDLFSRQLPTQVITFHQKLNEGTELINVNGDSGQGVEEGSSTSCSSTTQSSLLSSTLSDAHTLSSDGLANARFQSHSSPAKSPNRSTSLAENLETNADDAMLQRVVDYVSWRLMAQGQGTSSDEVMEAAMHVRELDERVWRERLYEKLTGVHPIPLKLSLILPDLYIASIDAICHNHCHLLKDKEISHLVVYTELGELGEDLQSEFDKEKLSVYEIAQSDYECFYLGYEFLSFVHEGRLNDNRVAVVCDTDNLTASGLLTTFYLMFNNGRSWDTALKVVKGAQPVFLPNEQDFQRFIQRQEVVRTATDSVCNQGVNDFLAEYKANDNAEPDAKADERFFQGALSDCEKWFAKLEKRVKKEEASEEEEKELSKWLMVRDEMDKMFGQQTRRRRRLSVGFHSPAASPFGGGDRPASVASCSTPRPRRLSFQQ